MCDVGFLHIRTGEQELSLFVGRLPALRHGQQPRPQVDGADGRELGNDLRAVETATPAQPERVVWRKLHEQRQRLGRVGQRGRRLVGDDLPRRPNQQHHRAKPPQRGTQRRAIGALRQPIGHPNPAKLPHHPRQPRTAELPTRGVENQPRATEARRGAIQGGRHPRKRQAPPRSAVLQRLEQRGRYAH